MAVDGVSPFENDGAGDLIMALEDEPTEAMEILDESLQEAISEDYLDVDACTMGLAAAELVAALNGHPSPDIPDDYVEWVGNNPTRTDKAMIENSLKAIERIRQKDTELYELFEEATDSPYLSDEHSLTEWNKVLDDLIQRLKASVQ